MPLLIQLKKDLLQKRDYNGKQSDIEAKQFNTSNYNKFTGEILNKKIKQKGIADRSNISGFIDNSNLEKKIATVVTNTELKVKQDRIEKLQAFDTSYFRGKSHFRR